MALDLVLMVSVLVVAASIFDVKTRRIPNPLLVAGLIIGVGWHIWHGGWNGLVASAAGFGLGLALMLPGWLLRFTGGGDVKLLAAVGSMLGAGTVIYAFVISILTGATFALMNSIHRWARQGAESPTARYGLMLTLLFTGNKPTYLRPDECEAVGKRFPLAPAIAVGSIAASILFMN